MRNNNQNMDGRYLEIAEYMEHCLFDPEEGFYSNNIGNVITHFVTSPEICSIFSEILALRIIEYFLRSNTEKLTLIELGAGDGVMMHDILKTIKIVLKNLECMEMFIVEKSPLLQNIQRKKLSEFELNKKWVVNIEEIESDKECLVIVSNEFYDCFPCTQFLHRAGNWYKRVVGSNQTGDGLEFLYMKANAEEESLIKGYCKIHQLEQFKDDDLIEISFLAEEFFKKTISMMQNSKYFLQIIVDYGYKIPTLQSSFQAIKDHKKVDVFESPGECDLTFHVDFGVLMNIAKESEAKHITLQTQRNFLLENGLMQRVESVKTRSDLLLDKAIERLIAPEEMGHLFKVMVVEK